MHGAFLVPRSKRPKKKEASAYYLPGLWLKSFELLNTVPVIDGFSWFTVVVNFIAAFLKW